MAPTNLFGRKKYDVASTIVNVPNGASIARISFSRHCTASPTGWNDPKDELTWKVEQFSNNAWILLGSSTTMGGIITEPTGEENTISWDETPLLPGGDRRLRISLRPNGMPVDTEGFIEWL